MAKDPGESGSGSRSVIQDHSDHSASTVTRVDSLGPLMHHDPGDLGSLIHKRAREKKHSHFVDEIQPNDPLGTGSSANHQAAC